MQESLLSSLRKYSPKENYNPLENFITEAFAWLLKTEPTFSMFFIEKILGKLGVKNLNKNNCQWVTQANFNGKYPDMVCYLDNKVIVFENKAWSPLHENQLHEYKSYTLSNFDTSWIVLITATAAQHEQNPDVALCWNEIHKYISDWIEENDNVNFVFYDFLQLLETEGMGPSAPISHASLKYYYTTINLEKNLSSLIKRIENKNWENIFKTNNTNKKVPHKKGGSYGLESGRIGINFLSWEPGIFVGVLLDGDDHRTIPIDINKGPDFCVILNFDTRLHRDYLANKYYIEFVKNISSEITKLNDGWEFYHHAKDKQISNSNRWHPIHIRKPLLDVFAGTKNTEEQETVFFQQAKLILDIVTNEDSFWSLRESFKT